MATNNGVATDAYSGRSAFYLRLYVWRSALDIANNRSQYSWWLRAYNSNRSSQTYSLTDRPWAVNVEGSTWSGDNNLDFRGGQEYIQFGSGTTGWKSHNSSGALTVDFSASHTTPSVLGSASLSGSFAADVIPQTPSGLSVTRVSDSQQTLAWSKDGTTTGAVVQRSTDDGPWQQVGAPSGNVAGYSDTTTSGNHKYEYRVAGKAAAGQSGWSNIATVYTTPAKPSAPSAVRDGDDIIVSGSLSSIASGANVRDGSTVVASNVTLPWRHVAPSPSDPHTYTISAVRGSLESAYSSASNTVQLISPPNAPVGLTPNGGLAASDGDVMLSWTHNPVDSSPQSAFELQWRPTGGAWTTVTGSTASSTPLSLTSGDFEWQVRTKGAHVDWSPWSAVATVEVIDRPGVAILQPEDTWDSSTLEVQWSWFQAQSRPQSAWEARLLDAGSEVVESRNGSGAGTTTTFTRRLTEGDWTVEVRAATGDVWSDWGTETFTVTFDPPAPPFLSGEWDESQGGVSISVQEGSTSGALLSGGAWFADV